MRLDQLLNDINQDSLIELFGGAALAAVEANLTEKNNKAYVHCPVRDKPVQAKREELVRQLWLQRLTLYYGYPTSRLGVEYPITFGRDTSKRADIVVMDADRPTVPYLIVEVKQGKLKDGKEQLRSYTHAAGAPLAMWCNGVESVAWHRKNPNYFVEIPDIPTDVQTIDDIAGQPWSMQTLIEVEQRRRNRHRGFRDHRPAVPGLVRPFPASVAP